MSAVLTDTSLVLGRYLRQTMRSKFQIYFGVLMPLLYLLFFGPLLTDLPLSPKGDSWQVLVPGLLLQLGLFGASFAGFALILDKGTGVVERMRVTPVSRLALLLGRVLRDAVLFVFQAILLVLAALLMGLRAPLAGVLIGFAFVAVLTVALASLSYLLAMKVSTPQGFGPVVNAVSMPAILLSGLMLPMALAPTWLDVLSHFMPFRYLVDAVRSAYVGEYANTTMLYGVLVAVAFTGLAVYAGTREFRRAGA
ncbi:transport permease protein [Streptomyces spiroverticillatus]|uniref:Transport permease protein n=1 Tax=Streptomyces finlayi TaxID=67296 RepID=A0A918X4A1_9ACTN|nr:ABC transporter permease [Streptomyces finlayi]GHA32222.1 transport permease protein [Streptomyces spiroverticillatus]GHD10699.1 transport permease protein [Streptomyces finlayi]